MRNDLQLRTFWEDIMIESRELFNYFQEDLLGPLQKFELQRLKIRNKLYVWAGVLLIPVLGITMYSTFKSGAAQHGIVPALVAYWVWVRLRNYYAAPYSLAFKKEILCDLIRAIDPSLRLEPEVAISRKVFEDSLMYEARIDQYCGEDFVSGRIGKTQIAFSEIHALFYFKNRHKNEAFTVFRGLFIQADFNKNFKGFTLVYPDISQRILGRLGQTVQDKFAFRGQLVKLEDPEFEKMFSVFSSDQIEARYILSPALMSRLKQYVKKTKKIVRVSFVNSCVNVAIPSRKNLFEPKIFSSLLDFQAIIDYYQQIQLALDIVDDLNLNCRIWTKQ